MSELWGSLITRGGMTPADAWEVTLDDALELTAYWGRTPPLRELVSVIAQMLGWEGPSWAPLGAEGDGSPADDVPGEFED